MGGAELVDTDDNMALRGATTNDYAREVANSIKFFIEGEWVDASSDAPINARSSRHPRLACRKSRGLPASASRSRRTALNTLSAT
jgi:hypothetical protein